MGNVGIVVTVISFMLVFNSLIYLGNSAGIFPSNPSSSNVDVDKISNEEITNSSASPVTGAWGVLKFIFTFLFIEFTISNPIIVLLLFIIKIGGALALIEIMLP